jgi:hypothetical protein
MANTSGTIIPHGNLPGFTFPGDLTVIGGLSIQSSLTADTIFDGSGDLRDAINSKASSDILDVSSIGSFNTAGTNAVADWSAIDSLMMRRLIGSPVIKTNGVESFVIDLNEGIEWDITIETNTLALADDNRPTDGLSRWGGKVRINNSWTNTSEISIQNGWL